MLENRVKRIMREGGLALAGYVGPFCGPEIVEIIGLAGLDAVRIDLEHFPQELSDVQVKVLAAERVGITPIVRVPGFDPAFILRLLDIGVQGIMVPGITGAAQARAAVQAVRYPPLGERSVHHLTRAAGYGSLTLQQHMEQSNREVLLGVLVEGLQAVEEIDLIAGTEGVDLISIGPSDLAGSLGVGGQPDHPKLVAAIEHLASAIRKSNNAYLSISIGHLLFPRSVAQLRELGVRYANCGPEPQARLLRSMAQQTEEIRRQIV